MKKLLTIINNPLNSENLISYSLHMASDFRLHLQLIYIQNPALFTFRSDSAVSTSHPVHDEIDVTRLETDRKNALEAIEARLNQLRKENLHEVPSGITSETGAVDVTVNQYISENDVEMLILENRKDQGFWFLDPTNLNIVLNARCPSWIIQPETKYSPCKKIIYATDYNEADIHTISHLVNLTGKFSPEITALHVADSENFNENALKSGFRSTLVKETGYEKISVKSLIDNQDSTLGDIINDFALDDNADLIVLLKTNKGFMEKIIKSSSAKNILKKVRLPVLVYHE